MRHDNCRIVNRRAFYADIEVDYPIPKVNSKLDFCHLVSGITCVFRTLIYLAVGF